ncbi:hypothetical protein GCM10010404_33760 [Nonomuraea africana]
MVESAWFRELTAPGADCSRTAGSLGNGLGFEDCGDSGCTGTPTGAGGFRGAPGFPGSWWFRGAGLQRGGECVGVGTTVGRGRVVEGPGMDGMDTEGEVGR